MTVGCGCGGGGSTARQAVTKYEISDDPLTPKRQYLTEREANAAKSNRQLKGTVQPVTPVKV
jgi:hypothetical protein